MKTSVFFILWTMLWSGCPAPHRDQGTRTADKLKELNTIEIKGPVVDAHTRCVHYHSEKDVIAIKMKCCNAYYPCITCHAETAGHEAVVWPRSEFDTRAVVCGICYEEMTIQQYLNSQNQCPHCEAAFNPGCSKHYHLYFDMDSASGPPD